MYITICFNSKTRIVINDLDIDSILETYHQAILSRVGKWLGESSIWIIE